MKMGEKIDFLCKEKGLSVYQLCKKSGIPVTSGYRILRQKTIAGDKLRRIADILGVSPTDLLTDDDNSQSVDTYLPGVPPPSHSIGDIDEFKKKITELELTVTRLNYENKTLIDNISFRDQLLKAKDQLIDVLQKKDEKTN